MIYRRAEGELIRNGLNLYPKGDPYNWGGIFRIGRLHIRVRYSPKFNRWYTGVRLCRS